MEWKWAQLCLQGAFSLAKWKVSTRQKQNILDIWKLSHGNWTSFLLG